MKEFKFSEDLADKVKDALIDRIVDAFQNDSDTARSFVECGFPGIGDMDGMELLNEYCDWYGLSCEDDTDLNDDLLQKMHNEHMNYLVEKDLLDDSKQSET